MRPWPRWGLYITLIIVLLFAGAWLTPRILSLYYQVIGGKMLEEVLKSTAEEDETPIACTQVPVKDGSVRMKLEKAAQLLIQSSHYNPINSQAYLLLGRTYCLLGNFDHSIEAYQQFSNLRPENPLGNIELGFAYANFCNPHTGIQSEESQSIQCEKEYIHKVLLEFNKANIDPGLLLTVADGAYVQHIWDQALFFYLLYERLGQPESPESRFRKEISANMEYQNQNPQRDPPALLSTHILSESLQIEAETYHWFFDATPLNNNPGGDPDAGVLWWNGDAITGLEVLESGEYKLTVSALNTPPAPVRFQITVDFQPVGTFELIQEDMSWQEFSTNTSLDDGFHIIGIRFLNDDIVNGMDRNLTINWVKIYK